MPSPNMPQDASLDADAFEVVWNGASDRAEARAYQRPPERKRMAPEPLPPERRPPSDCQHYRDRMKFRLARLPVGSTFFAFTFAEASNAPMTLTTNYLSRMVRTGAVAIIGWERGRHNGVAARYQVLAPGSTPRPVPPRVIGVIVWPHVSTSR